MNVILFDSEKAYDPVIANNLGIDKEYIISELIEDEITNEVIERRLYMNDICIKSNIHPHDKNVMTPHDKNVMTPHDKNVIYNNTTDFNYTDNFSFCMWIKHNYSSSAGVQYLFTNGRADYFIHDGAWKLGIAPPQVQMWIKPIGLSIEKPIVEGDYVIKDEASGYGEISVCNQQLFESIYKEYKEDV